MTVNNLEKKFNEKKLLGNLCFNDTGAIVGVIGPNGAGKTTLCNILTGSITPDEGNIEVGEIMKLALQAKVEGLDDKKTVWEELSEGKRTTIGEFEINSRAYCGRFNFRGNDQQKFVDQLRAGSVTDCT